MRGDSRRGKRVNACKTLVGPKNARSATRLIVASRLELPLLGSNQDSPDPESGVLPVTPRGRSLQNNRLRPGRKALPEHLSETFRVLDAPLVQRPVASRRCTGERG